MSSIETWAEPARSLKVFARTQFAFNRTKFPSTAVLFQGSKSPDGRLPKKQVIKLLGGPKLSCSSQMPSLLSFLTQCHI